MILNICFKTSSAVWPFYLRLFSMLIPKSRSHLMQRYAAQCSGGGRYYQYASEEKYSVELVIDSLNHIFSRMLSDSILSSILRISLFVCSAKVSVRICNSN